MLQVSPGVANVVPATLVAVADGSPITAGSVDFFLLATSGDHAGTWWDGAEGEWSETEVVAAAGAHQAKGHWTATIAAAAWLDATRYTLYAAESDGLDIPAARDVLCADPTPRVTVLPAALSVGGLRYMLSGTAALALDLPQHASPTLPFRLTDATGAAVDLTDRVLRLKAFTAIDDETLLFQLQSPDEGITITDAEAGQFSIAFTAQNLATAGEYLYELWDDGGDAWAKGRLLIRATRGPGDETEPE